MNAFVEKFKEEVREYCERLEAGLLQLEHDPENHQAIDEIFRIMHTMKGSGGMFGFDLLSDVTHDLESLFDLFRSKKQSIDSEIISFTLNSIDGLHHLMVQEPADEHLRLAEKMKAETRQQIARLVPPELVSENEKSAINGFESASGLNQNTFYISFVPNEDIFSNGTNPLYLIDELNALGECNIQVSFDRLPDLSQIDPDKCYISWFLFIATAETVETLNDVFIFVGDNAAVEMFKVAPGNVIRNEAVLAAFLNAQSNNESWDPEGNDIQENENEKEAHLIPEDENDLVKLKEPASGTMHAPAFAKATVDSIRVDSAKIDQYMNLVSELITAQSRMELLTSKLGHSDLELISETFGKLSRQLRNNAFDMSLIPLQSVAVRFKRLIHDLSKSLGKEVSLVTEGLETELDKNIIEKLLEPLLHIVRNSLDHGIESKEERLANGKDPVGTISIKASTVGSCVLIEIRDDGAGLDAEKIRKKAIAKGVLDDQAKISDEEVLRLIFEPGFSTSELVTDVSGRGVGMDVVKKRVQEMRGSVELSTEIGSYTEIKIKLPLSLSIIDGLLTIVGESHYVIPSSVIKKIYIVRRELLKKGLSQVVELEGEQVPYINLHEAFDYAALPPEEQFVVAVSFDSQPFGLVVDEVVHEYQAVIKPLGKVLKGQDVFSGASILGTGQLALVIDANKLIQKYSQIQ